MSDVPAIPARERLMEALREMYVAGGRVGLNYALLDKLGFDRSLDHIRSTYDEQHPVPSLSRVLAAVEEVVAEERRKWEDDDEDSTDHLTRCECCGGPIGEEEEMVTSDDGDLTLHRRCYEEAYRDNWD